MVKRFLIVVAVLLAGLWALGVRAHEQPAMAVAIFWLAVLALLVAGALHLVVNVWRGAWRYEQTGTSVVRIRRTTGEADVLTSTGWRPLTGVTDSPPVPPGAPAPER